MVRMGNASQLEATPEELDKLKSTAERFTLEKLLAAVNAFDRSPSRPAWAGSRACSLSWRSPAWRQSLKWQRSPRKKRRIELN